MRESPVGMALYHKECPRRQSGSVPCTDQVLTHGVFGLRTAPESWALNTQPGQRFLSPTKFQLYWSF